MVTEKDVFISKAECGAAKSRDSQRHKQGWQPIETYQENGKFIIVWQKDFHSKLYKFVKWYIKYWKNFFEAIVRP